MRGKPFKLFSDELPTIQLDRVSLGEQALRVSDRVPARDSSIRRRSTFTGDTFSFPSLRSPDWDRVLHRSGDTRGQHNNRMATRTLLVNSGRTVGMTMIPKTVKMQYEHNRMVNDTDSMAEDIAEKRKNLYGFRREQNVANGSSEIHEDDNNREDGKPKSVLQTLLDESAREAELFKRSQNLLHPRYYKSLPRRQNKNDTKSSPPNNTSQPNNTSVQNDTSLPSDTSLSNSNSLTNGEDLKIQVETKSSNQAKRGILKRNKSLQPRDFSRVSLRTYTPLPILKHCEDLDISKVRSGRLSAICDVNFSPESDQILPRINPDLLSCNLYRTESRRQRRVAFTESVVESESDSKLTTVLDSEQVNEGNNTVSNVKNSGVKTFGVAVGSPNKCNETGHILEEENIREDVGDAEPIDKNHSGESTTSESVQCLNLVQEQTRVAHSSAPKRVFFRKTSSNGSSRLRYVKKASTPSNYCSEERLLETPIEKPELLELDLIDAIIQNSARRESIVDPTQRHIWKEVKTSLGDKSNVNENAKHDVTGDVRQVRQLYKVPVGKTAAHVPTIQSPSDTTESSTIESFVRTPDLDAMPDFNAFYDEFDFSDLPDEVDRRLLGEELIRAYRFWDRRRKAFPKGLRKIEPPTNITDEFYPRRYGNVRIYKIRSKPATESNNPTEDKGGADVMLGIG